MLLIKKACNVVFQSSKDEELSLSHEFFLIAIRLPHGQLWAILKTGIYPSTFVYSCFSPKDSVSLLFAQLTISVRCFHGWHQRKIFEVQISRLLKIGFPTLFLTAEAQLVHHLFAVTTIFLEISEFRREFYNIEFYKSIQD